MLRARRKSSAAESWDISSNVVDFDEAIAFFRAKVPMTAKAFAQLDKQAKEQAFTVAGATQLDLVTDVFDAIDSALKNGTDLDDFKAAVGGALADAWGSAPGDAAWRVETVFRTNVQGAYAAGRYAQQSDPETLADRPYWMFDLIEDGRECDICAPCDGVVLPADDPWWRTHRPLLHPNCRCDVQALTEEQATGQGIHDKGPDVEAADGFGTPPKLNGWAPTSAGYPPELWSVFEEKRERTAA